MMWKAFKFSVRKERKFSWEKSASDLPSNCDITIILFYGWTESIQRDNMEFCGKTRVSLK